jgi:hypothetical protein
MGVRLPSSGLGAMRSVDLGEYAYMISGTPYSAPTSTYEAPLVSVPAIDPYAMLADGRYAVDSYDPAPVLEGFDASALSPMDLSIPYAGDSLFAQYAGDSYDTTATGADDGAVAHFAFVPPGGVLEAQTRLFAWGRPKNTANPSAPYGWDGPLFPGDFGLIATDLDGVDSHRTGLAIASFQRWYNATNAGSLNTQGIYNEQTHNALVSVTPTATIPTAPAPIPVPASLPQLPPAWPSNVIPFPGTTLPLPGSATIPTYPGGVTLDPSVPGTIFGDPAQGGAKQEAPPSALPWVLGGLAVASIAIVFVVNRKKKKAAA